MRDDGTWLRFISVAQSALILSALTRIASGSPPPLQPDIPVILEHPSDATVPKGESATLNCKVQGTPTPRVVWFKDGKVLPTSTEESRSHRVALPDGSLFLLQVNHGRNHKSDAGTYWCVASNIHGEVESNRAVLKISYLKEEFRVRPKQIQVVVGSQAVMECSPPKGYPEPEVFWKKDGKLLDLTADKRFVLEPGGSLSIGDVQTGDGGFYSCMAQNEVLSRESTAARLVVYEKPKIITEPRDIAVDVGQDALFVCGMSGGPNPVVSWQRKGGLAMPADRARVIDNNLRIERVRTTDEGEYQCVGRNPAGTVEASARLIVQSSPWFVEEPSDTEVREGAEVILHCEANGSPAPSQFWTKEGAQELMFPGYVSADRRLVVTEKTFTIRQVVPSDEAQYSCTALNAAGSNSAKAYVRVSPEQVVKNLPPLIVRGPANQTLPTDSVVIMPCSVKSISTDVDIVWLKNGVPIKADSRISTLPGGSLEIRSLKKEDTDTYTCAVKTGHGEDRVSAFLRVEVPTKPNVNFERMPEPSTFPSAPGPPQVSEVTDSTVTLRWAPPDNLGSSPISDYSIQYYSPQLGSKWIRVMDFVRSTSYTVDMLQPSSVYVFVVRANNNHGTSEPSPFSSVVRTRSSASLASKPGVAADQADQSLDSARRDLSDMQVIKLRDVKVLNDTAVKLSWTVLRTVVHIGGFYLRWQSTRLNEQGLLNITNQGGRIAWTQVVGNLQPFTKYKFFITPYYRTVEGNPSNIMDATTAEAVPSAPPSDVQVRMTNLTTVRVSWKPPPQDMVNGNLRGYLVLVIANRTRIQRNITINNEKASGVTLFHLVTGVTYRIRVSAFTAAGISDKYSENVVTMDEATLRAHLTRDSTAEGRFKALFQEPWFISSIGASLWAVLVLIVAVVWWRRRRVYKKHAEGGSPGGPLIKINDGSVMNNAREALWVDHQTFIPVNGTTGGHLMMAPYGSRYVIGSDSPRVGYALNGTDGRTASVSRQQHLMDKPYTELSHLTYGGSCRTAGSSYYHQIPVEPNYVSSPYYQKTSPPSPTPYATTTLVMNGHRQRMALKQGIGSANTFSGLRHQPTTKSSQLTTATNVGDGCSLEQRPLKRASSLVSEQQQQAAATGPSAAQTDVSFLSGANSSSNSSSANGRRCRPGQPALLDFLPPPPSQPPPPIQRAAGSGDDEEDDDKAAAPAIANRLCSSAISSNGPSLYPADQRTDYLVHADCADLAYRPNVQRKLQRRIADGCDNDVASYHVDLSDDDV